MATPISRSPPPHRPFLLLSLLSTLLLLPSALASPSYLRLRGRLGADDIYCASWRYSVETNDAGPWTRVPSRCAAYVKDYFTGPLYASDSEVVADDSLNFAGYAVASNGGGGGGSRDAWVFDVDETLLSNLPYYSANGYGSELFNETSFDEWVDEARAPALPASLKLYNELRRLGVHVVLLTGRSEFQRQATERNLNAVGYSGWDSLILRDPSDMGKLAVVYKSEKRAQLVAAGYRIIGNSGDQWSDLYGSPMAQRSFKLPNPMYHIE